MDFSEEEQKRFAEIEEELRILNEEAEAGNNLPIPQYEEEEFLRFRTWQHDRMNRKIEMEREAETEAT